MPISTKEQLKAHIHGIHDYIRNSGAGYGMTAMSIFTFFYGLKIIEKKITESDLDNDLCRFTNLMKIINYETNETYIYPVKIVIGEKVRNILSNISEKEKKLAYYVHRHLPQHLTDHIWVKIIRLVNEIPTIMDKKYNENVNLSGKVYEYFIGRDKGAISELGAYFTDRHITNYIINKVKPTQYKGGIIKSMIDPFGGSGGFTLGYLEYLNNKKIHWHTVDKNDIHNYKKIHHYDMNEDVIKIAGLEFFTFTDKFPDTAQFVCANTFQRDFDDKYDYIFTNPPYGGDKTDKTPEVVDNEKILSHIKNILDELNKKYIANEQYSEIIKRIQIKRKHYENISQYTPNDLTLIYNALIKQKDNEEDNELIELILDVREILQQIMGIKKINDTHASDIAQKQVNYSTCSKFLREYIENNNITGCNDKEACSLVLFMALLKNKGVCAGVLKEGVFFDNKYASVREHLLKNFNVKYVISIEADQFENTTTKTSALIFENTPCVETNEVIFYDLKTEKEKEDVYEKLEDRKYALTKRKGNIIKVVETEITRTTIKEICEPTIIKNKKGEEIEKYYYSLDPKKYNVVKLECSDKYKLVKLGDPEICKFGQKSKRNASYGNTEGKYNFYTSSDTIKKCDDADYNDKYIMIGTGGNSCIHTDSMFSCSGDMILLKPLIDPMYIYYILTISWNRLKDGMHGSTIKHVTKGMIDEFQIPIPRTDELLNEWVAKISEPYDAIQKKKKELLKLEEDVKAEVKRICEEEDCDLTPLDKLCEYIKTGKNKTPDDKKGTKYPYYGTANITGYTDHYLFDGLNILVARNGTMGKIFYTNGKIYPSDHIFVIKIKECYNIKYIYHQLINKSDDIIDASNGSTIKGISLNALKPIKIPIPQNKNLIKALEPTFNQIEELQKKIKIHETEYQQVLKELEEDIKPKEITNIDQDDISDNSEIIQKTADNDDVTPMKIAKKAKPVVKQSIKVNKTVKVVKTTKVQKSSK